MDSMTIRTIRYVIDMVLKQLLQLHQDLVNVMQNDLIMPIIMAAINRETAFVRGRRLCHRVQHFLKRQSSEFIHVSRFDVIQMH